MSSAAREAFDANLADIEKLIDYFELAEAFFKGRKKEVPAGADVVLRAAIVLLITYWEAYLEDIVSEALEHLVTETKDPSTLPKELRKAVARDLKTDKDELSPWKIAGDGWRQILQTRLPGLQETRNRSFNTPKSDQTRHFIHAALGISDITESWKTDAMSHDKVSQLLDELVEIRGQIAHRGKLPWQVTVEKVKTATNFINILVAKTGGKINSELKKVTGKELWQ